MAFVRGRRAAALGAAGALLLTAAAALMLLQHAGYFDTVVYSTPETGTAFNVSSLTGPAGAPVATPAGGALTGPPISRLVIPAIGVDAPVVAKGVGADGAMEVPGNAHDVAWYDFTARPGAGGNTVFSGHVDFRGVGAAVFWDLGKLEPDDRLEVRLADGTVYQYRVTEKGVFGAADAPVDRIVGPTGVESVTIVTCTGTFDRVTHQYDKRLVVRAERIEPGATGGSAEPQAHP